MHGGRRPGTGGSRPGAGRPKGSRDKLTTAMAQAVSEVKEATALIRRGVLPLEFLLKVMRDSRYPTELRLRAAGAAAPYVHPKMPQAVVVAPEAKIEKVILEIVGVPPHLLRDERRQDIAAESSENNIGGTPQKCLAVPTSE